EGRGRQTQDQAPAPVVELGAVPLSEEGGLAKGPSTHAILPAALAPACPAGPGLLPVTRTRPGARKPGRCQGKREIAAGPSIRPGRAVHHPGVVAHLRAEPQGHHLNSPRTSRKPESFP